MTETAMFRQLSRRSALQHPRQSVLAGYNDALASHWMARDGRFNIAVYSSLNPPRRRLARLAKYFAAFFLPHVGSISEHDLFWASPKQSLYRTVDG
jgi:hypothetical protein